jgi:hypothetical protein
MISTFGKHIAKIWIVIVILGLGLISFLYTLFIQSDDSQKGNTISMNNCDVIPGVYNIRDTIQILNKIKDKEHIRIIDIPISTEVIILDGAFSSEFLKIHYELSSEYFKARRKLEVWVMKNNIEIKNEP